MSQSTEKFSSNTLENCKKYLHHMIKKYQLEKKKNLKFSKECKETSNTLLEISFEEIYEYVVSMIDIPGDVYDTVNNCNGNTENWNGCPELEEKIAQRFYDFIKDKTGQKENNKLKEENKKLKEENEKYREELNDSRYKMQEEIDDCRYDYEEVVKTNEQLTLETERLKEELKKCRRLFLTNITK